jgi:predicted nucleotidyltransferase
MKKRISQSIKAILEEVKQKLREIYGENLKSVILYGSHARGDFADGSDIDIIIVLKEMKQPFLERERYFGAIWELDLKYDTVISIVPLGEEEYRTRRMPLILNAKREGIPIYEG